MVKKLGKAILNRKWLAITLACVFLFLTAFAVVSLVTVQACTIVGSIKVQKVVTGGTTNAQFKINVKGKTNGYNQTKTVTGGNSVTFAQLQYGTYIVTEEDPSDLNCKTLKYTYNGQDFTPAAGQGIEVIVGNASYGASVECVVPADVTVTVTNKYTPVGSIKVNKVLLDNNSTDPHEFSINVKGKTNDYNETKKVTAGNSVTFTNVPYGTYTVTETGLDGSGFQLYKYYYNGQFYNPPSIDVVVGNPNASGASVQCAYPADIELWVKNQRLGKVTFKKDFKDDNYNNTTDKFKFLMTSTNGYSNTFEVTGGKDAVETNLPYGKYTVKELTDKDMPEGYRFWKLYLNGAEVSGNSATFDIGQNSNEFTVKAINDTWSKIKLIKKSAKDSSFLNGAVFKIYNDSGVVYDNLTTAGNGEFLLPDELAAGSTWHIQETKAPDDYVLNDKVETITLHAGVNEVTFKDEPINHCWIKIKKVDSLTGATLNGATFELSNNKDFINSGDKKTFTLKVDGETQSEDLIPGHWWVREKEAPPFYLKDNTVKDFDVAWHEVKSVEFANTPVGGISVSKILESGTDTTTDFQFNLSGMGVNENFTLKAGTDPRVFDNLPFGTYTLTEKNAAALGYKLLYFDQDGTHKDGVIVGNDVKLDITIDALHKTAAVKAVNRKQGKIILQKQVNGQTADPAYKFKIRLTDKATGASSDHDVIAGKDTVINNIEYGTTYTVAEVTDSLPQGMEYVELYINGQKASSVPAEFTVGASNQVVTVKAVNKTWSKIKLIKVNEIDQTVKVAGAKFKISNNAQFSDQNGGIVYEATTDANGEIALADQMAVGSTWYIKEIEAPNGYFLNDTVITKTLEQGLNTFTLTNKPECWIKIKKVDKLTGEMLNNAVFEISNNKDFLNGGTNITFTLTVNGETQSQGLVPGHWWVREKTAPPTYIKDDSVKEFDVAWDEVKAVTFENMPLGSISISKLLESGTDTTTPFQFNLKGNGIDQDFTLTAGGAPRAFENIPLGTYTLTEKDAASLGYKLSYFDKGGTHLNGTVVGNDVQLDITVDKIEKSVSIKAVNHKLGKLILQKQVIGTQNNPAQTFTFHVKNLTTGDDKPYSVTAGTDTVVNGLEYGKYQIWEATDSMPAGYAFNNLYVNNSVVTNPVEVTLGADNLQATVKAENRTWAKLKLIKKDATLTQNLPDAEFRVYNDTKTYENIKTDANGEFLIADELPVGSTWYILETKAPAGYELDNTVHPVTLHEGVNEVTLTNSPLERGWIKIKKIDSVTNSPINGAVFELATDAAFTQNYLTMNVDGETASPDLKPGHWYVREKTAPAGYLKDTRTLEVDVELNKTNGVTFANTPIGSLRVSKELDGNYKDSETVFNFTVTHNSQPVANFALHAGEYKDIPNLTYGDYTVKETTPAAETDYILRGYKVNNGTLQETSEVTVNVGPQTNNVTVAAVNRKLGKMTFNKVFLHNYSNTTDTFKISVTGKNYSNIVEIKAGEIKTLDKLDYGTYTVQELPADMPQGYVFSHLYVNNSVVSNPATVTIDAENTNISVTAENDKQIPLTVRKVDAWHPEKALPGMKFLVADNANFENRPGGIYFSGVTKDNGEFVSAQYFPYGTTLWLKETEAPAGYEIDPNPKMITLTYQNNVVLFADPPINNAWIKIVKLDAATNQRINGAIFQIANNEAFNNSFLIQITANGEVTTDDLLPGDYWVKEYQAPAGYTKDTSVQKVTLAWHDTKEVTFKNTPSGSMLIVKTDATSGDRLTGAKFDIFSDSLLTTKYASIEITSTAGTELKDVPVGTYYFVETQAPAGYALNQTPVKADVAQGKVTNIELKNTKSDYVIWKKDSATLVNLTGAEFDIYNGSNLLIGHYTTDADGKIPLTGFAAGTYKAVETKAPTGYKLLASPVTFTVVAGQTGNIIILNDSELEYGTGSLKIRKVDASTNNALKGAVFDIYSDVSLTTKAFSGLTTNANGEILAEGMDPGTYWVVETKAPTGYRKVSGSIKVTVEINKTTSIVVQNTAEQDYQTGTDDYNMLIAGGVLLLGGLAMVFFSKRKKARA